jgi:hypothetical protein
VPSLRLLRVHDGLLEVLQRPVVADEAHEPELEPVVGDEADVLLLRPVLVLAGPHRLHLPQRDGHLVRHLRLVALRGGHCQGPVAAERDPRRGHEQHAGDRAGRGRQVALRGPEKLLVLVHGEPLPEHLLHAAGLEDLCAQCELPLQRVGKFRAQGHCRTSEQRKFSRIFQSHDQEESTMIDLVCGVFNND